MGKYFLTDILFHLQYLIELGRNRINCLVNLIYYLLTLTNYCRNETFIIENVKIVSAIW